MVCRRVGKEYDNPGRYGIYYVSQVFSIVTSYKTNTEIFVLQ